MNNIKDCKIITSHKVQIDRYKNNIIDVYIRIENINYNSIKNENIIILYNEEYFLLENLSFSYLTKTSTEVCITFISNNGNVRINIKNITTEINRLKKIDKLLNT